MLLWLHVRPVPLGLKVQIANSLQIKFLYFKKACGGQYSMAGIVKRVLNFIRVVRQLCVVAKVATNLW
jgi:hypothetical protein